MTRISFAVLTVFLFSLAESRAELPVAPPPREVRSDGSRDPVPVAEPPVKGENPAATVERIIKNSKDVGDKLAQTDTGTDTRKTQGKILSDIDALINQQENPPPPQPDKDKDKDKDKEKEKDKNKEKDKKDMNPDMGPKKDMPMDGMGMGMDMTPMPKGGMGDASPGTERKPRMGDPMNDTKKDQGKGDGAKQPQKGNSEPKKGNDKGDQKGDPGGATAGNPMGKANARPALPIDEELAKDVWGHLPDKVRQQMSQYYKEDFTPKYAELLRLYYSSLADKKK